MADWLSGSDFGDDDAPGASNTAFGKGGVSAATAYKQLAGWALGKVIGKNSSQYADTEEGLAACAQVSEEVGVRAGLLSRKGGQKLGNGANPNDPVPAHIFLGTELTRGRQKQTANRQDKAASEESPSSSDAKTKKPRMHLRDFDPLERGEAGVAPLLRGDFFRLVNISNYENGVLPKQCSTGGFSTSWSSSFDSSWTRLTDKARELHSENSLVDFIWRRAADPHGLDSTETASTASSSFSSPNNNINNNNNNNIHPEVCCISQPIDFEQIAERGGARDSWRMIVGASTSGTSFRSAKPSAARREGSSAWPSWRGNAIANLFHCPVEHAGRLVLNIVRHGVAGFASHPSEHVALHLELTVRHVLRRQLSAGLPLRMVSCNLLNHYKASGEPEMTERQLYTFQEVMRRVNARQLPAVTSAEAPGLPKDLPLVQYAQLLLPGNTDQWEMGADYNRDKNVDCFLLYLQWVTDDAVHAITRLLIDSHAPHAGPGGVHAASASDDAGPGHWQQLDRTETLHLQRALLSEGTADKAAVIDAVTWGDSPVDAAFKSILLLPLVRAPDTQVWETLVRVLPEYLQKRTELHHRAYRSSLDLTSAEPRPDPAGLIRHLLHIVSALLGLVYRRLVRSSPRRIALASSKSQEGAGETVKSPEREGGGGGGEAGGGEAGEAGGAGGVSTEYEVEGHGTDGEEGGGGGKDGEQQQEGTEDGSEGPGKGGGGVDEDGILRAITVHAREIERARMSVNLLRTLVQAELGGWEGGYAEGVASRPDDGDASRRRFSRATSMSVAALLNQTLGVVAWNNCKSGLDRTGLQTATQCCVSVLWSLYPEQRWTLHLAVINSHVLQARAGGGGEEVFPQPSSMESFVSEQERLSWFKSLFRERPPVRAHRLHDYPQREGGGEGAGRREATHVPFCDEQLLFEDQPRMLRALHPFRCLQRNFMLGYLTEANAVITFASTGVRGMKYEGHPLIGALIPRDIRVSQVHRHAPKGTGDSIRMMQLTSRQYLGLKSLAGGKLAQDTLTDLGRMLLIDAAKYRCS